MYDNGTVSSTNTAVAPYFANEVISYECSHPFQPNPPSAVLTCICVIDDSSDSPSLSWRCDPEEVTTTCQGTQAHNCSCEVLCKMKANLRQLVL